MGIYVNSSGYRYGKLRDSEIFVDKTGLIAFTNKMICSLCKYICVSAPEGFGKTSAAHMLTAYYSRKCDSRALFQEQLIAGQPNWDKYLNRYHVIFLPMKEFAAGCGSAEEVFLKMSRQVVAEFAQENPGISGLNEEDLGGSMRELYGKSGDGFLVLVDDWDCFLHQINGTVSKKECMKYLELFRSLLEDKEYIHLSYLWGGMPAKYWGGGLGELFMDYSLFAPGRLAEFIGFTREEIHRLLESSGSGMRAEDLQEWYGGYLWNGLHGYHPKGTAEALVCGKFGYSPAWEEMRNRLKASDNLQDVMVRLLGGGRERLSFRASLWGGSREHEDFRNILIREVYMGRLAWNEEDGAVYIPNKVSREFYRVAMKNAGRRSLAERKKYPDRETALMLLEESERLNPGPWKEHSLVAARCGEKIALLCGDMDPEKAYILALLHDIGRRFGTGHMRHVVDGYVYMRDMGYEDAAKICVTHSFPTHSLQEYIGKFDVSSEETGLISSLLSSYEYDDYDRLVQLCDSVAMPEGPVKAEVRMDSVAVRYGYYPPEQKACVLKLKAYFEEKMKRNLYQVILQEDLGI